MSRLTIPACIQQSIAIHSGNTALSLVDSDAVTYAELNRRIQNLAMKLKILGLCPGDKIALLAPNGPNWGISYLSILHLGATVVPILNDFSATEITNILKHSEAKALFVSESLKQKIDRSLLPDIFVYINVEDFSVDETLSSLKTPYSADRVTPADREALKQIIETINEDDLAAIIYTSGTTGFSKGVMLTHRNIVSNIRSTYQVQSIGPADRMLSILPMPHTYECTLGFLMPLFYGASVYYLSGVPSPTVLLAALDKIRPTMMLSVPLVIEKIYKNRIAPKFSKGLGKVLYAFPPARKLLHRIAGAKLMQSFGGQIHFFGIGGALLDETVERFLWEAKFPYYIGYGLTETSPLVAGTPSRKLKFRSTGYCLPGQEMKLINVDPATGEGEIVTRGDNVMKGYYKNDDLTRSVFTPDGWFRTGDLGYIDPTGRLFFKGHLKNVIIGANGKNIYPEEIEAVVNRHKFVLESIVYEMKGKLVAKVHLDYQKVEEFYNHVRRNTREFQHDLQFQINHILADIQHFVNMQLNDYSHLALVIEQPVPFEKTPTMKIKKFMYVA